MSADDCRFLVPEALEAQLALARVRVRERRAGLKVVGTLSAAAALGTGALLLASRLGVRLAERLLIPTSMLAVMLCAGLPLVAASACMWRARVRRLTHLVEWQKFLEKARRNWNERPDLHRRYRGVLRARGRVHPRLREALRREP